ncbi:putative VV A7-like early transcription factor large subunit [Cafeteria roenbergensis virus]|uniref:Putative VV A7-like early transcription factor large subunit n=1 Tax=Cafeteria roenbergensis virus (strain BV-PW1) TaxID=693272 RepID=E3T562_CROVB|nr:putative VV A7-like early transcription factor large subunit [Cafeteria roenbergensis virus BV-PW1]ADO67325.1 putative VV A7-like early transcription factor large subunit [Cafeteria roenbergensis virus BV-PW1]
MLNKPFKVIHQYKNDYQRTIYLVYIYLGSLVPDDIISILDKIKNYDLLTTFEKLSKKEIVSLTEEFGEYWYESLFISDHITKIFTKINKDKKLLSKLTAKFGKEWEETNVKKYKLVRKNLIFNHQTLYYQYMKDIKKSLSVKKELDYRTQIFDKKLPEEFSIIKTSKSNNILEGGADATGNITEFDVESIEDFSDVEDVTEKINKADDTNEILDIDEIDDNDEDLENSINKFSLELDETDKTSSLTADLISQALNEKSWKKEKSDKIPFDSKINELTYDMELNDVYHKHYIYTSKIYPDDNIKTLKEKITYGIPLNPTFTEQNHILPSRQYLYSRYYYKNKEEIIMIGQKWTRRNELLNIDVIPNSNLKIYQNLRGNLKYLRDSFGTKLKREEEEDFILRDYTDFITNNEIYLLDVYSQLGQNFNVEPEKKNNLYDVFISIYYPFISSNQLDDIINMLNKKENSEEIYIESKYKTIRNDLKLENEISELVNDTQLNFKNKLDELFYENHIIQSIIHVNMSNVNNRTGTILDDKFNLYAIFDSFIVNDEYPFIQFYSIDNGLIYKFYQKSTVINNPDIMKKWFENAPYGISIRKKLDELRYISLNITETGKIEYRVTWREEDNATINDVRETYNLVRNLLKKINKETAKVKFINPEDERFSYAFVNSIQKFKIPEKLIINHNDLSEFSRFFFPYVSLVIEPRKRMGKVQKETIVSKFGTYLRYKRVSRFENRMRMHLRILYIMRNFEFSDKGLISEVARQFNITLDLAAKELDFVRDKYSNVINKSRKVLKKLNTLPKSKPPGIGIDIQGRKPENYKIRITGARNKEQLDEIINFIKTLIFLYVETYLYKKTKYQKIKDTLKKLTNIAKRRNLVEEIVDYSLEVKNVKVITSLDKKRLGFRPEEGQNQWTRSCQNSGDDKKRRPVVISDNKIQDLQKKGFKYDNNIKMYTKIHKDKDLKKDIIMRAINLPTEDGKPIYYYCDPDTNKEHKYIGFLSKGNNPDNLCMPCCFKKDQYASTNPLKTNYFKKCIGEMKDYKVEKKSLDLIGDKLYILQETNKIQEGRFLLLPKYLEFFFNKLWNNDITIKNHYMIKSTSGYFLKFMVKDAKFHFLAAISAVYGLSYDQIITKITDFFNIKDNIKYFNFLDEGKIFQRFEKLENYLEFIKEKKYLDYKILGEILTLPGVLEKGGLGIYIFNKNTTKENNKEKISYYLDCLNYNNQKYLMTYQTNIILIKENKYYFPIFKAFKNKTQKNISIDKKFTFENINGNIINQIRGLYISSCSEKILEQISISSKYKSKYLTELFEQFKPTIQYLDSIGKVRYLKLTELDLILPVFPSGIDYLYDYTFESPIFLSLKDTLSKFEKIINIDNSFIPEKILYLDKIGVNYLVHSVVLANKLVIPIKTEKIDEQHIKKLKLKKELKPQENNINNKLENETNPIDKNRLIVKENQYLEEGFNLFRFELSYYLQKNQSVKNNIIDIVRSDIPYNRKKELLRPLLISITNPKLKKFINKSSVKKQIYFIMSLNKKKDLTNFKIQNQRNYCYINKDKDTCNNKPFCNFVKDKCYFSMEDEVIIEYLNRILEEIIQDSVGFKELIQEDNYFVSDIVDNKDFTNRENQKILKVGNLSINKIMVELFGENSLPKIGRRTTANTNFIDENYPQLEEVGKNLSQEIIPNQNSNIRAFINSYYWLKNSLYSKERRNLGYHSSIQNQLVFLLKAKIIDFVLQYNENVPKSIEKYFVSKDKINSKLMEFAKNPLNTDGNLEFYVLYNLYNIPIVVMNKYNEITKVFTDNKIITKNFDKIPLKNSIKIKQDITADVKIPRKIYSIY